MHIKLWFWCHYEIQYKFIDIGCRLLPPNTPMLFAPKLWTYGQWNWLAQIVFDGKILASTSRQCRQSISRLTTSIHYPFPIFGWHVFIFDWILALSKFMSHFVCGSIRFFSLEQKNSETKLEEKWWPLSGGFTTAESGTNRILASIRNWKIPFLGRQSLLVFPSMPIHLYMCWSRKLVKGYNITLQLKPHTRHDTTNLNWREKKTRKTRVVF